MPIAAVQHVRVAGAPCSPALGHCRCGSAGSRPAAAAPRHALGAAWGGRGASAGAWRGRARAGCAGLAAARGQQARARRRRCRCARGGRERGERRPQPREPASGPAGRPAPRSGIPGGGGAASHAPQAVRVSALSPPPHGERLVVGGPDGTCAARDGGAERSAEVRPGPPRRPRAAAP